MDWRRLAWRTLHLELQAKTSSGPCFPPALERGIAYLQLAVRVPPQAWWLGWKSSETARVAHRGHFGRCNGGVARAPARSAKSTQCPAHHMTSAHPTRRVGSVLLSGNIGCRLPTLKRWCRVQARLQGSVRPDHERDSYPRRVGHVADRNLNAAIKTAIPNTKA
jgi:hypothetical protein